MADIISDLKDKFRRGDIVTQLIFINVGIFIITALTKLVLHLFNKSAVFIDLYTSLPADFEAIAKTPWTIITYMFMHAGILHLFFNMLVLYWFGRFFLNFFSAKHLRGLYFLGGIMGGLFFVAAYHIFPVFQDAIYSSRLTGASASVLALVIAVATKAPSHNIRLLLVGSIRLKYLALFIVVLNLITITGDNPGGQIAHLGGALSGYLFVVALSKGWDLTRWINAVLDIPYTLRDKYRKMKERKKQKMKIVKDKSFTKRTADYQYNSNKKASAEEIDRILDKIKESGYTNLSEEEKRKLFDAGK